MLELVVYSDEYEKRWDRFVLNDSINGTFLQTRKFLNYHPPGRFVDISLLFVKGNNIVAVMPANLEMDDVGKVCVSHRGSTFGGIVLGRQFKKLMVCEEIFALLDEYLKREGFSMVQLKFTSGLYSQKDSELLDYFAFINGYTVSTEMGYYINLNEYQDGILVNLSSAKRRNYRYSLRNEMQFKQLSTTEEVAGFYDILCDNYMKFKKKPIHTLEEIMDLVYVRFPEIIRFYGVYHKGIMIAGTMVFLFDNVFHTQYLACMQDKTDLFASEFMYVNLIEKAKQLGCQNLSFGTATLEGGKVLNKQLAHFKEGFGTYEYVNRTYTRRLEHGN